MIGFLKGENLLEDDPLGGYMVTPKGVAKIQELESFKKLLFNSLKLLNVFKILK